MPKFAIILFFTLIALLTPRSIHSQWVQQTLPVSGTPYDMQFINSNTGWMTLSSPLTFLKTTNSGTSWFTLSSGTTQFGNLKFFNDTLGYTLGSISGNIAISKTTNGGLNWTVIYTSPNSFQSMNFINPDTGWVCGFNGSLGAIWRTTDGCATFQQEIQSGSSGMDRIFFLSQKVNGENIGWCSQGNIFRKTTNSGTSWFQAASISAGNEIYFINKDTGWISNGGMFKSTDGGASWINEPMPTDPSFTLTNMVKFIFVDKNKGFGTGGERFFGSGQFRGVVWVTTNGGINWGYQQPDTSFHVNVLGVIYFSDSSNGWSYAQGGNKGVHTTNGGGQIIYTGVNIISTEIPTNYKLFQNYPNPFNPSTNIKYQIVNSSYILLAVYDLLGREISILVNQKQSAGTYEVNFNEGNLSSGIYFYMLTSGNFKDVKKMLLVK